MRLFPIVFFIMVCLAMAQAGSGFTHELADGRTRSIDTFSETLCDNGKCNMLLSGSPLYANTGISWKPVIHSEYVDGFWVSYTEIDLDTYVWVEYIKKGQAYVCWNVSEKYDNIAVPMTIGTEKFTLAYPKGVDNCNLFPIKEISYFEFGEHSTTIQISGEANGSNEYKCRGWSWPGSAPFACYNSNPGLIGDDGDDHYWWIETFNITGIPGGMTIDDATYKVQTYSTLAEGTDILSHELYFVVYNETNCLVDDTFSQVTDFLDNGTGTDISGWGDDEEHTINVTDQLTTAYAAGGVGCIGIRGDYLDRITLQPDNNTRFYSSVDPSPSNRAYLNITYSAAAGDSDPPNMIWVAPTTNNTMQPYNQTYFVWNVSVNESMTNCEFEINGTNHSGTQVDAATLSYCYYNETGYNGNLTSCAVAFADDASGNMNHTYKTMCIDTNISHVAAADTTPPDVAWIYPTSNGTLAYNVTYTIWNISVTENIGSCNFEINGSNQTGYMVNNSASSYCWYNETGFNANITTCAFGYVDDGAGNNNVTLSYMCMSTNISHVAPPPATPPDVSWIDPVANGSEAVNVSYIAWNISVTTNIQFGYIEVNATNHTCTVTNNSASSYCVYNSTGLTSNQTLCSVGYASNGTLNMTPQLICRNIHYYAASVAPSYITTCTVRPLLIFVGELLIAWEFDC